MDNYTHLGTNRKSQWDQSTEIKQRIGKARSIHTDEVSLQNSRFTTQYLPTSSDAMNLKTLLYEVEAWTLSVTQLI